MSANLVRRLFPQITARGLRRLLNLWPPYWAAGIHVEEITPDFREARVSMRLHWYNANYVGTHFGGSLYAMTDPFFMLLLMRNLGSDYVVWDKAARIEFKKPGLGRVRAEFRFSEQEISEIRARVDSDGKYVFDRPVDVLAENGESVASVVKTLYVRKKG